MNITFNELRRIKDSLPHGSIAQIATDLGVTEETVRNYFGGYNFRNGESMGINIEQGPDGGIVHIEDTTILDKAKELISAQN